MQALLQAFDKQWTQPHATVISYKVCTQKVTSTRNMFRFLKYALASSPRLIQAGKHENVMPASTPEVRTHLGANTHFTVLS